MEQVKQTFCKFTNHSMEGPQLLNLSYEQLMQLVCNSQKQHLKHSLWWKQHSTQAPKKGTEGAVTHRKPEVVKIP